MYVAPLGYFNNEPAKEIFVGAKSISFNEYIKDIVVKPVYIPPECECIRYLREVLGVPIRGNANTVKPNVDRPYVGGVVLQNLNGTAHASYIMAILPNGNLWVAEANFNKCVSGTRVIIKDSPQITGYWFKNLNSPKP